MRKKGQHGRGKRFLLSRGHLGLLSIGALALGVSACSNPMGVEEPITSGSVASSVSHRAQTERSAIQVEVDGRDPWALYREEQ